MKRNAPSVLIFLVFAAGLAILLFPAASNWYANRLYAREIEAWNAYQASGEEKDYSPLWDAAERYNQALWDKEDRLSATEEEKAYASTLLNPLGTGMMGFIDIDKIDVHLSIYQDTEEKSLQSGCGWWIGTSLPTGGPGTHCVITAHSGLVKAKMFTDLDKLELGDTFTLSILDREMTYEVDQILVTEPEDYSPLALVPGADYVTLYTCTPYGVNTHRLLVRGCRIDSLSGESAEAAAQDSAGGPLPAILFPVSAAFLAAILWRKWKKRYRGKRELKKKLWKKGGCACEADEPNKGTAHH